MSLIPRRWIALIAVVVIGWAAAHAISSRSAAVTPLSWPAAAASPSAAASALSLPVASVAPSAAAAPPLLPDVMRRLNDDTGRTATSLYQLVQELELGIRSRLEATARQLEPGR